jgi:hypothetical protein
MTEHSQNLSNAEKWALCRFFDDRIKTMEKQTEDLGFKLSRLRSENGYDLRNRLRFEENQLLRKISIAVSSVSLARRTKTVILYNERKYTKLALGTYRMHPHVDVWKAEWRFHATCPPEPFDEFFRVEWEILAAYRDYIGLESVTYSGLCQNRALTGNALFAVTEGGHHGQARAVGSRVRGGHHHLG